MHIAYCISCSTIFIIIIIMDKNKLDLSSVLLCYLFIYELVCAVAIFFFLLSHFIFQCSIYFLYYLFPFRTFFIRFFDYLVFSKLFFPVTFSNLIPILMSNFSFAYFFFLFTQCSCLEFIIKRAHSLSFTIVIASKFDIANCFECFLFKIMF